MTLDPETIVRCYGCEQRVRAKVTSQVPTGEDQFLERWCFDCTDAIDQHSQLLSKNELPTPAIENNINRFLLDE